VAVQSDALHPSSVALSGTGASAPRPLLGRLSLSPAAFRAARSGPTTARRAATGTRVRYSDSQAATTSFKVQRRGSGVRRGKRCVPTSSGHPRHARRCTRWLSVGTFKHRDAAGPNRFRFAGRVHGRRLRPGRYRLVATARNAHGHSRAKKASFRIVR
jgi:hypothetical protein